jgi:hypothetical protein
VLGASVNAMVRGSFSRGLSRTRLGARAIPRACGLNREREGEGAQNERSGRLYNMCARHKNPPNLEIAVRQTTSATSHR